MWREHLVFYSVLQLLSFQGPDFRYDDFRSKALARRVPSPFFAHRPCPSLWGYALSLTGFFFYTL